MDKKQHCTALFVDLSKAFDSVDHELLLKRLINIGIGNTAINCFNYLTERTQCVSIDGLKSDFSEISKGVPQGSILAPFLFSISINTIGKELHLYADETVIYSVAPSLNQAINDLQLAFQQHQVSLHGLKLVLNTKKTKFMVGPNPQILQLLTH